MGTIFRYEGIGHKWRATSALASRYPSALFVRPAARSSVPPTAAAWQDGGVVTPNSSRKQIEDLSRPTLVRLSSMPKLVVPLGTLVLVVLGLFAPLQIAVPALALVFVFFAWIAYLSWPVIGTGGKVLRGVMLGLIVAMAASRL